MDYDIVIIADLHWGVLNEEQHLQQLEFIFEFLDQQVPDLLVLAGDYFDFKLYLNSKRTITSLEWFDRLYQKAKEKGIKKIRMIKGTDSHDADQLEVFRKYEEEDEFFRLFLSCTSEETLPGLQCLYCPDELITTRDYILTYSDQLLNENDVCFFHGSFDVVLRKDINIDHLFLEEAEESSMITSVTFPMNFFQSIIKYACVGGHWHDGKQYENIFYTGSPTCWAHNEMEPKGISFLRLNMEDGIYFYRKILNPLSPRYLTFDLPSSDTDYVQERLEGVIQEVQKEIIKAENDGIEYQIRLVAYPEKDSIADANMIKTVKDFFINNPNVVLREKSKKKRDGKKKKEECTESEKEYKAFVRNKNVPLEEKIHRFIKEKTGEEIPMEFIERYVKKYLS